MNIGIIENLSILIQTYEMILKNHNCTIKAKDGKEMIEQFENLRNTDSSKIPELVIIEVNLPKMDGFEITQWLKANYPSIKIVVCTTIADESSILRMIKLGVNCYLTKDEITIDGFEDDISQVLERGNYFTPRVSEIVIKSYKNSEMSDNQLKMNLLTEKEKVVIKLVCNGLTIAEIADHLFLSKRTIDSIIQNMLRKLNVKNKIGLVIFALKNGLIN